LFLQNKSRIQTKGLIETKWFDR